MNLMNELLGNKILLVTIAATLTAQILKAVIVLILEKKLILRRMADTGGMPSSHSAAVTSLATGIGLTYGWSSPLFSISAVLAGIVIHDASGIRRAAGKHAELLNEMSRELAKLIEQGFQPAVLKTLLGHTYPQVAAGSILGIFVAWLLI